MAAQSGSGGLSLKTPAGQSAAPENSRDELARSEFFLKINLQDVLESRQRFEVALIRGRRYLTLTTAAERQAFWVYFWWRQANAPNNYFANKAFAKLQPAVDPQYPVLVDIDREVIFVQPALCARQYKKIAFVDLSIGQLLTAFFVAVAVYLVVFRVFLADTASSSATLPPVEDGS